VIEDMFKELLVAGLVALVVMLWRNTLAISKLTTELKVLAAAPEDIRRLKNGITVHAEKFRVNEKEHTDLKEGLKDLKKELSDG